MRPFGNNQTSVEILPAKADISGLPWCREALVLRIKGSGALRWERRELPPEADPLCSALCLTLRGTPLLSREAPVCETCESLLSTGWGRDVADCPELARCRDTLNGGFSRLEDAVPALSPLLGLLRPGLYVLADGDACPADGGGRFFWDVPDGPVSSAATAQSCLCDDDYDYEYFGSGPAFLYPSQKQSRFDPARADDYRERFRQSGPPPRGFALHVAEGLSLLLDGHHKAAAAALLGRTLPCLTVFPLGYYRLRPVDDPPPRLPGRLRRQTGTPRRMERKAAVFGPFQIPIESLPEAFLPEKPWETPSGAGFLPEGRLADRLLPEAYRTAGAKYPTARQYAVVQAAKIGYPTDRELETWLSSPCEYRPKLRAALVLLRGGNDPRLKNLALCCAAGEDLRSSLKEEAFRMLADMHGDPEAEAFFIDYFIRLETRPQDRPRGTDALTEIAHSFWA